MTTSTPEPARPAAAALLAAARALHGRCSGRSWWSGIAVAVVAWLWSNAVHNLSVRRISTGFAFLGREAGMPIADTWLAYSPKDTYLRAFIVGIVNTLRVAVIGIVLATMLGHADRHRAAVVQLAAVAAGRRLCRSAARHSAAAAAVVLVRADAGTCRPARGAWKPVDGVFLSNRGLILPSIPLDGRTALGDRRRRARAASRSICCGGD